MASDVSPDSAELVFSGKMLGLTRERWGDAEREIIERADSVAIVATDGERRLTLVRQFRPATRRELLELPAGTVAADEDPLATARRELSEETGLHGGRWRAGPVFFTSPGFCRERIHLFFAEGLEEGERTATDGEPIELVRWTADEAAQRLGELEDGKTLAGLVLYLRDLL